VASERRLPDFLYIGTSKAGSTWLFNTLAIHPQVHLASSKGLYFFDQHYDRGVDWYLDQFRGAGGARAMGEISHSYLSSPGAEQRIAELNPAMRLLVCLREPVDRAFSDYLDLVKNGQFGGSFEAALERYPRLIDRGRYASHLHRYSSIFSPELLSVQLFDDLRVDPQAYADATFDFLGVDRLQLPAAALKRRQPAGTARSRGLASAAKRASAVARQVGLRRLRSRVKRSVVVRQLLYRPYADDRPQLDPVVAEQLRRVFAPEVEALAPLLGVPVAARWGYAEQGGEAA
jgi:hypothetical protein